MRIVRNNDESSNNLERHFRELRNLETVPSSALWDKLEYKLDEERERVKHDHWYKALIGLLIPFTIINVLLTYNLDSYYKKVTKGNNESTAQRFSQNSPNYIPNNLNGPGGWGNFFNGDFLSLNNSHGTGIPSNLYTNYAPRILTVAAIDFPEDELDLAPAENVNAEELSLLKRKMLETSATAEDVMNFHTRKLASEGIASVKGFHIGVEGGVHNNWMLHKNNSLEPLIGNKIHRKFDVGAIYGFSVGYDFSNRYGIEAEFVFKSPQGQDYWELRYGKILINGQVNLEYMLLPVMFKYKWTKIARHSFNPHVINLVTGIQYSRLRDAHIVQNGLDLQKVSELFNRDELGLLLGVEYDLYVHRNYFFSIGARATMSTDARAFPYFNSSKTETYNLLIGANASFNFLATKRKKNPTN